MTPDSRPSKKETCLDCGGTGRVSFASEVMKCAACNGTGTVGSGGSDGVQK